MFTISPPQVSDTSLANAFEDLSRDIVSWMDGEIGRFEQRYPDGRRVFDHRGFSDLKEDVSEVENIGEYYVPYIIHRCLITEVFDEEKFRLGMHPNQWIWYKRMEQAMTLFDPKKGK